MSPKTIHVGTKIVKTWQQLQICKIVFLRSPSASLHTPTSPQFANTWKVAPFWQTPPLLPVKIRKSKIRGCKKYYLQIVEKLLNSGTLAVSSCTNLALIKTAASLENTFIFQNKQKQKKTVEIWKNSKYFATWDLSLGNANPPQMITIISFLLKYYWKEEWDFIYERFTVLSGIHFLGVGPALWINALCLLTE